MLSDDKVAAICGQELDAAVTLLGSQVATMQQAIDYSEGLQPGNDDPEGDESRDAVSLDVADMVEAVYAQIAPALEDAGGVQFDAYGADDEAQAAQETAIVRSMLLEGYSAEGGFVAFSEAIKDALLMRTGILALWVDRTEEREPEQWEAVPLMAVGELIKPNQQGQRIEALQIDRDDDAIAEAGEELGRQAEAAGGETRETPELFKVSFTRVNTDRRLCVEAVPRENFVTSSLSERDPNKCRFAADRIVTTRTRLVAEGFDKARVAKLKRHDPTGYENFVRRYRGDEADPNARQSVQEATDVIEVWRCYPQLSDTEGALATKRYRVYYSRDDKVILADPAPVGRVCYGVGNVILAPHRMNGVSLFDRVGEVQAIKTRGIRDWLENSRKVNRPRLAVDESLSNLADAKDATVDIIRVKGPNAITPVPSIDAGPSLSMLMEFMDRTRSERGGASLDMQSASMQIASNQTAQGIERQYSVKEQLAAMMARTFGETALRSAFQIAHYLLRTQWGDSLTVKVDGQWQQVNPSQWRPRHGVRVRIGQSESQRQKRVAALQGVLGMQMQAMQSGLDGVLCDADKLHNTATDIIVASLLPNPDRYLIDPKSPQAAQAMRQKQSSQQASMQSQADGMRAALMLDKYKTDAKAWTDLIDTYVRAAIEEAKLLLSPAPLEEAQQVAQTSAGAAAGQAQQDVAAGAPQQAQQQQQPQPAGGAA